jgi:hypothetical protein
MSDNPWSPEEQELIDSLTEGERAAFLRAWDQLTGQSVEGLRMVQAWAKDTNPLVGVMGSSPNTTPQSVAGYRGLLLGLGWSVSEAPGELEPAFLDQTQEQGQVIRFQISRDAARVLGHSEILGMQRAEFVEIEPLNVVAGATVRVSLESASNATAPVPVQASLPTEISWSHSEQPTVLVVAWR